MVEGGEKKLKNSLIKAALESKPLIHEQQNLQY